MSSSYSSSALRERLHSRLDCGQPSTGGLFLGLLRFAPSLDSEETLRRFLELFQEHDQLSRRIVVAALNPCYNPAQRSVSSLDQVLSSLGLKTTKTLGLALLLADADLFLTGDQSLVERMRFCCVSALITRDIVDREGACDPELGFVCALLRNWGRMLLGGLLYPGSSQTVIAALLLQDDDSTRAVCGLAPAELSYHLWRLRRLPASFLKLLQAQPPYRVTTTGYTHEDALLMWSDLGFQLAHSALGSNPHAGLSDSAIQVVLDRECATHTLEAPMVAGLIAKALADLPDLLFPGSDSRGEQSGSAGFATLRVADQTSSRAASLALPDPARLADY